MIMMIEVRRKQQLPVYLVHTNIYFHMKTHTHTHVHKHTNTHMIDVPFIVKLTSPQTTK